MFYKKHIFFNLASSDLEQFLLISIDSGFSIFAVHAYVL